MAKSHPRSPPPHSPMPSGCQQPHVFMKLTPFRYWSPLLFVLMMLQYTLDFCCQRGARRPQAHGAAQRRGRVRDPAGRGQGDPGAALPWIRAKYSSPYSSFLCFCGLWLVDGVPLAVLFFVSMCTFFFSPVLCYRRSSFLTPLPLCARSSG